MTNMTNDSVIFRERGFLKIPRINSYLYIICILYINMSKIAVKSENRSMLTIPLSFVTIVTLCHELTARKFGYPEYFEYLCNSKIKQ